MKTKKEFTVSFRFGPNRERDDVLRCITEIAESFGFKIVTKHTEKTQLLTASALECARRFLISPLPSDLRRSLLPTSKELVRRMTRRVNITVIKMEKNCLKSPSETFTIRYCLRNWYPAVGIELWQRRRVKAPAGFITVKLNSSVSSKRILKAFLDRKAILWA